MKKIYAKPQITFEDFSLSTSIASGCREISNHIVYVCGQETELGVLFNADWRDCTRSNPDNICYDVPQSNLGLFSS